MLDQSCNLNCCLLVVFISDLFLFQEIVLLNPCVKFSKKLMFSFVDKVTTKFSSINLKCCSSCFCCCHLELFLIFQIYNFFVRGKSSSISLLIKDKSRDFQKLMRCFNGTTASVSNVLSAGVLYFIFVLY